MKKKFNKNDFLEMLSKKKKIILIVGAPVILIIMAVALITSGMSLGGLLGNSVIEYYCDDDYILKGTKCEKNEVATSILLGDVHINNSLTDDDTQTLLAYLNDRIKLSDNQQVAADVDENGTIDKNDYELLQVAIYNQKDKSKTNDTKEKIGYSRICPKSTKNIKYKMSSDNKKNCIKTTTLNAYKNSGNYTVSYKANGGSITSGKEMSTDTFTIDKTPDILQKNKYSRDQYNFSGWAAHNLTNDTWLCYANKSKTDEYWVSYTDASNKIVEKGACKYGLFIYADEDKVYNIATPNQQVEMVAQWTQQFLNEKSHE